VHDDAVSPPLSKMTQAAQVIHRGGWLGRRHEYPQRFTLEGPAIDFRLKPCG
jgi:hypothetical protein